MFSGNRLQYDKRKLTLLEWMAKTNIRRVEGNEYEETLNNEDMYGIGFNNNLSALKT